MTALTARQLYWLHIELGTPPEDAELQSTFDMLGSVRDVAIATVRRRLNERLNSPLSVSISGVASVGFGDNVKALERQLARLLDMDDDPSDDPAGGDEEEGGMPVMAVRSVPRRRRR